jgi:hypothetical protein
MFQEVELFDTQLKAYELLTDDKKEYVAFGGGANGGKTWLGCLWLQGNCLRYPGTRWFIGRVELKRLKKTSFATFKKASNFYNISDRWKFNGQENAIYFDNGSVIEFLDLKYMPSDPLYERFGSLEFTGGWIEEAGEVDFGAFDVLKSRVGRWDNDKYGIIGKIYITCNPKKNWLYKYFYLPWKYGRLKEEYAFIQSLVTDNVYREKNSIKKLESIIEKSRKERLLYGNWDYEDEPDQLILYEWLQKDVKVVKGKKFVGVDVARYGDDLSVILELQGNKINKMESIAGRSIDKVADWVKMRIVKDRIDSGNVGIDTVGLGAGVYDILKRNGFYCKEIISGDKAPTYKKYSFQNLRSFMWWLVREQIRKGKLVLKGCDDKLAEDLTAPKYEIRGDKKIAVESKDQIKKRIGRSTDYGDAFVYAVYMKWIRENRVKPGFKKVEDRVW